MNNQYYWLKFKENYFGDDSISWIEEQPNGKEYLVFYLKLYLRFVKTTGACVRKVGDKMMPYDINQLAHITNTDTNIATKAMGLFMDIGMVAMVEEEILKKCLGEGKENG